ncbi:MAG: PQQ-dependent sugar dehydrogenase [Novosphingobium sp.]|nr:PQQ-dependent sugar dehydrogenase [Novosphingobium sp.]
MLRTKLLLAFSLLALGLASCGANRTGENNGAARSPIKPFQIEEVATFDEPWAMEFDQGTGVLFITEKRGAIKFIEAGGEIGTVSGVPEVDYGGQGGFGDFVFAPGQDSAVLDERIVYLSWAEKGDGDTRGAAVARANMVCEDRLACELRDLEVIWRQAPKVTGRGHYSHRITFSPDGKYLFIASGDRQKQAPAQDLSNTLGTIVRLLPDGTPAPSNPFSEQGMPTDQIWSYGHRNILGLAFDGEGRLWDVEHGPRGGDELNLVTKGTNYGWPLVSNGKHYRGKDIPDHSTRPDLAAPAISWNPVIAPGDMIFYSAEMFRDWQGQVLIAAMRPAALVRVGIEGKTAHEIARYEMERRIRAVALGPDGAIWLIEDGRNVPESRLLKLTPARE